MLLLLDPQGGDVPDNQPAIAVLIGVEAPQPVVHAGVRHRFKPLLGVRNDINWYVEMLEAGIEATSTLPVWRRLEILRLIEPEQTTARNIKKTLLSSVRRVPPGGLFVLVMVGHGFQIPAPENSTEKDGLDEAFAASDGDLVLDDFFGGMWKELDPTATAVAFVDTCHADGIPPGLGFAPPAPAIWLDSGPSRIFLSASEEWEGAIEDKRDGVNRGVMSRALENAWRQTNGARDSYQKLFDETALTVGLNTGQTVRTRYVGPDPKLLRQPPFSRSR
jgi:hypothetical protein